MDLRAVMYGDIYSYSLGKEFCSDYKSRYEYGTDDIFMAEIELG
jgi:hypothetical protein